MLRDEKLDLDFRVTSGFINRYQLISRILWFKLEPAYILVTTGRSFLAPLQSRVLSLKTPYAAYSPLRSWYIAARERVGWASHSSPIRRMSIFVVRVHLWLFKNWYLEDRKESLCLGNQNVHHSLFLLALRITFFLFLQFPFAKGVPGVFVRNIAPFGGVEDWFSSPSRYISSTWGKMLCRALLLLLVSGCAWQNLVNLHGISCII